jgi:hypothetical protein
MLSESLRRMRDNGGLRREIDPDDLASGMVSLLQGGILLSQARNDIGPLRSAVNVMPSRAVTTPVRGQPGSGLGAAGPPCRRQASAPFGASEIAAG